MKSREYAQRIQAHTLQGGAPPIDPAVKHYWLSLHSENPAGTNDQSASEIPGLSRVLVNRSPTAWTIDGQTFINADTLTLPKAKRHHERRFARFWQIGTGETGTGLAILGGKLVEEQEIVAGMVAYFLPGALRSDEF